jgi:hypothetical protein
VTTWVSLWFGRAQPPTSGERPIRPRGRPRRGGRAHARSWRSPVWTNALTGVVTPLTEHPDESWKPGVAPAVPVGIALASHAQGRERLLGLRRLGGGRALLEHVPVGASAGRKRERKAEKRGHH